MLPLPCDWRRNLSAPKSQADIVAAAIGRAKSTSGRRQVQFYPYVVPEEILALPTKAEQIRALAYCGWPDGVIAKSLGIKNQHARNTTDGVVSNAERKAAWSRTQKNFTPVKA